MNTSTIDNQQQSRQPRFVYFVDDDDYIEGHGYRASIVQEGRKGYAHTGTWPQTGAIGETRPIFVGHTIADAKARVRRLNEGLGVSVADEVRIVLGSMSP